MPPQFHPHGLSVEAWAEPGGRVETTFSFWGNFPEPKTNLSQQYPIKTFLGYIVQMFPQEKYYQSQSPL